MGINDYTYALNEMIIDIALSIYGAVLAGIVPELTVASLTVITLRYDGTEVGQQQQKHREA
jgi:hypothetical protein